MQGQVILTVTRDSVSAILELFEGDNVALNDRFSDIQTFEVVGGYSQTFRVPAVDKNQEFFGPLFNANYTGYDFTTRLDATLSVDTIPIAERHPILYKLLIDEVRIESKSCIRKDLFK